MSATEPCSPLLATLLQLPPEHQADWCAANREHCTLELIGALKAYADQRGLSEPQTAAAATATALLVAEHCTDPQGRALAAWAHGNWAIYYNPQQAISCYQQALAGYRAVADAVSSARLLTNLVFPLTECGRLVEAEAAVSEARTLLQQHATLTQRYQMVLEQNAGWLLHTQGHYAEALAVYQRALDLAYALDDFTSAVEIQVNRTITLEVFGHIAEEERALQESRVLAERHGQRVTVARIDLNLGELYVAQGRLMEALRHLQIAHTLFAALDNQMELAAVLLAEAALFGWLGALREARRGYTEAHRLFVALDMQPQVGVALVRGAVAHRRVGAFTTAAQLLAQAAALWTQIEQPLWKLTVRLEQAELALAQGEPTVARAITVAIAAQAEDSPVLLAQCHVIDADALAEIWRETQDADAQHTALAAYTHAYALADQVADRGVQRRALLGRGRLVVARDPLAGRAALEAVLALDQATRQTLTSEELMASFQAQRDDLLAPLLQAAQDMHEPWAALAAIWQVKGGALADVLHRDRVDDAAAITQARERLAVLRWRQSLERTSMDVPDGLRERADPEIQAAEDHVRTLLRQRQSTLPQHEWAGNPRPVLRDLHADVLIEYARCGPNLVAVRADQTETCVVVSLGAAQAVAELLDDLQLHIQHVLSLTPVARQRDGAAYLDECQSLLHQLHAALIAPLGPLPAGARLLIAPCTPLYLVPFAALHDGEQYLVERHTLALTPCGALAAVPPPMAATSGALIIAASAAQRLSSVAAEAAAVSACFPASECLYDRPGSIRALQQRRVAPRVLHLAAHSVLREDTPLFSALQLHGELLSVEQCYTLPLAGTALVTLSGCTTGAGLETGGALLAFQTAFFAAGAHAVLSSLWPVDDEAASHWMACFYRLLASGLAPDVALQQTQCNLIHTAESQHPAFWAAFSCAMR